MRGARLHIYQRLKHRLYGEGMLVARFCNDGFDRPGALQGC